MYDDLTATLTMLSAARADGLVVAVTADGRLAVTGPEAARHRWRPTLAARKAAVVAALRASSSWWRITLPDRVVLVCFAPPATREEVRRDYPAALVVEPVAG